MSHFTRAYRCAALLFLFAFNFLQAGTPEQVADWKKRYQEAMVLDKQGKQDEALAVFSGILREDPQARGSLLMSGLIQIRKFDFKAALPFLEKFLALEPDLETGIIALLKVQQALGNTDKVEVLRQKLISDRSSGKNPRLKALWSYEREIIPRNGGGYFSVQENLELTPTRFIWAYVELDGKNTMMRRLEWTAIAAPNGTQYALGEPKTEKGLTSQYKIHRLLNEKPDYAKAREMALAVLISPPAVPVK